MICLPRSCTPTSLIGRVSVLLLRTLLAQAHQMPQTHGLSCFTRTPCEHVMWRTAKLTDSHGIVPYLNKPLVFKGNVEIPYADDE